MKRWGAGLMASLALVTLGTAGATRAEINVPAERRVLPWTGDLPACDDPSVLSNITSRFQQKESSYWSSALEITGYDHISQIGYRSNGSQYIPRRYCHARAMINDNSRHEVVYAIGEELGIIGMTYGVQWCVVGLDRNDAYSPACRAAYP